MKIPGWAQAIAGTLIVTLFAIISLLLGHIFTEMDSRLSKMIDDMASMRQQIVLLQAQIDTQSKFCRFPTLSK